MLVEKFKFENKCKKHNRMYDIVTTEEGRDIFVCSLCNRENRYIEE